MFKVKKELIYIVATLVILLVVAGIFFITRTKQEEQRTLASNAQASVNTQADWQTGITTNIDTTTSAGSVKIDNKAAGDITNLGTWSTNAGDAATLTDGNTATGVNLTWGAGEYVEVDFSSTYYIDYLKIYSPSDTRMKCEYWDGGTWVVFLSGIAPLGIIPTPGWSPEVSVHQTTSKLKCSADTEVGGGGGMPDVDMMEVQVVSTNAVAIHTTVPTQLDGGTNFWQWESFADTKTVPANTSVTYRYRTSTDSSTWTSWVGDIGSVTSRVGDTKYRYLQVEATLANTDGASTPTIDQYDIGYHTEQKPNKPSAQTAVTQ